MTTPAFADRVKDTTSTPGTGPVTLANSPPLGFRAFAAAYTFPVSNIPYCIEEQAGANWEIGYGSLLTATSFSRDRVLSSSNSNLPVSFPGGTSNIFVSIVADCLGSLQSTVDDSDNEYIVDDYIDDYYE